MENKVRIIGNGKIGDKAKQLIEKSDAINSAGLYMPKKVILSEDCFDNFFIKNRFGKSFQEVFDEKYLDDSIKKGTVSRDLLKNIKEINSEFEKIPLVVRSSAGGDSRGTGIYLSEVARNDIFDLRDSIRNVLGSYYSESAVKFREDSNSTKEFGIMVEPLIGQLLNEDFCLAPILSGFGYTSTPKEGAYISIVPGLGGGVNSRYGEKISSRFMKEKNIPLGDYIFEERDKMFSFICGNNYKRKSALLKTDKDIFYSEKGYSGKAYFFPDESSEGGIFPTTIELDRELEKDFEDLNLNVFFEKIQKLKESFENPQYFEWAMTFEKRKPKYWITQISDVNKKTDIMDFDNLEKIIFECKDVVGTGEIECKNIFNAWNPGEDVRNLYDFNQQNKNYVLLFSSRLTSEATSSQLPYSHFNNASAFIEIQDCPHSSKTPAEHLLGQMDCSGKIFGVIDYTKKPNWDLFKEKTGNFKGSELYQGEVKIISSEKQDRMIVSAVD